jgi:TolB protein
MKRVFVLAMVAAAVFPAASVDSARPPQLLTYSLSTSSRGSTTIGGDGLCLARANGANSVHVTRQKDDRTPAWSPNGRYVAFARQFKSDRIFDLLVADSRGRVIRNLSDKQTVMETSPTWSPDSKRLAFAGGWRGTSVWIADRAGTYVRRFVADASQPAWSPDGKRLAFTSLTGPLEREPRLETLRINRTGRRVIAANASDPTWSPDGRRLAFVRQMGPGLSEIAVANADGTGSRALTESPAQEFAPAWSPNGNWIAFERRAVGDLTDRHWIVVADAETGAERWTIRHGYGLHDPSWRSPVLLPRARRASCR